MIGWRPGIGDPTSLGWTTVGAYALAALLCWLAAGRAPKSERTMWRVIALYLAVLCLNKQLDLQSLMTEVGRAVARDQGWYEQRRLVQSEFILVIATAGLAAAVALFIRFRHAGARVKTALAGMAALGVFILIRATSFHKVDRLIGMELGALRANHLIELGAIAIVAGSALVVLRTPRR